MERLVLERSSVEAHALTFRETAVPWATGVGWVALIVVMATTVRILGQLVLGAFQHPEVFEYEEIATALLAGRGYSYFSSDGGIYVASQSSPLYIVFTALVYVLTGHSQAAMLLIQAAVGGLTAGIATWVGARAFSRRAGMLAGLLVALDPALVVFAAQLHSLTFDAFFNVCLVAGSVALRARPRMIAIFGLGMTFGLAALDRATALLLLPIHVVWLNRYRAVGLLTSGALIIAVTVLIYSPWPIRNTIVLGQLTLGSSETTEWLWRGNNPNANGSSLTSDGARMIEVAPPEYRSEVQNATEAQRVAIYRDAALSWIEGNPAGAAKLYVEKLVGFWWGSDSSGLLYPSFWLLGYRLWFLAIALPGIWAAWRSLREPEVRPTTLLILFTLLVVSATQAIFYVEGRHRLAVEPLLLIMSGAGLAFAVERWQARARGRLPAQTLADS